MPTLFDLSGRVALVTGASSGIGAATAIRLAELGAKVALGYHGNEHGARQATDAIAAAGGRGIALQADVRDVGEIRRLVDRATEALGPIDILVNNAGSLVARFPIRELTEAGWQEVLTLNLTSAVFAAQAVAASMIERRRGAIVNVGSIAGHTGGGPGAGLRRGQGRPRRLHEVAREGARAARCARERGVAWRHRHAVPRDLFHATDDAELRRHDPAGPHRRAG